MTVIQKEITILIIFLLIGINVISSTAQEYTESTPLSKGNWLYVGGSGQGNYSTIQSAVDNASDGDIIFIYNGMYYEHLLINKSISLIGENRDLTIIDGGQKSQISVMKIMTSPFHIENLTIQNNDWFGIEAGYLGMQYTMNNSTIHNCLILKTYFGVVFWNSSNMVVSNCTIFNNLDGLELLESEYCRIEHCNFSNRQSCISLNQGSHNNTVINCEMTGNATGGSEGIYSYGDYNIISHCNISNELDGIYLSRSNNTRIDNCSIYNNTQRGICIGEGNNNIIENCTICFNGNDTSAHNYGIHVFEGAYNLITRCNISNNSQGGVKCMWLCHQNTITKSTLKHNGYLTNGEGVRCDSPNTVCLNNFVDNYIQAYDTDSTSNWDDGNFGNYWDDYSGKDVNNDGIGDTPYSLYQNSNEDTHPLFYTYNPDGPSAVIITPTHTNQLYLYLRNIKLLPLSKTVIVGNIIIKVKAVCYGYTSEITKIEFYVDGLLRHVDKRPPYQWRWQISSLLRHSHTLQIIAYDSRGNIGHDEVEVIKFF